MMVSSRKLVLRWFLLLPLLYGAVASLAAPEVIVRGLFKDAALLEINGRQQLLKVGQRRDGIRLLRADSRAAVIEVDGQRQQVGLNKSVGGQYNEPEPQSVSLHRGARREYRARISVNGRSIDAIVDTGATLVAMSERHARTLGLDYENGEPVMMATASGRARGRVIMAGKIDLGGIVRHHIRTVVIEGDYPREVLLGMSFLEHLNMREEENILTLSPRYP